MGLIEMNAEGLKFEIESDESPQSPRFKVIGVGGGGSSAVARMMGEGLEGVEFCVMNTDVQALRASPAPCKVQLGAKLVQGLGTGGDPEIGKQAALEDTGRIVECIGKASMVFVTAGLGGGTGTGAAPVVASLAKELGALTVAIVTKPFAFEGPLCLERAEKGLAALAATVDTVIAIPNERLLGLLPRGTTFMQALKAADDVLRQAVQGISDIIVTPGLINRDFSNIRATMAGSGFAMMGTAVATGEDAAVAAARQAITCPLLDEGGIAGARGLLINITGSSKLGLHEVSEACTLIREATGRPDVQLTFGVVLNESMGESVKITVIATGFDRRSAPPEEAAVAAPTPEPTPQGQDYAPPVIPMPPPEEVPEEDDIETPAYLRRGRLPF